MAKEASTNLKSEKFVSLLIYPKRRWLVIFLTALLAAIFSIWIAKFLLQNKSSWVLVGVPMTLIGLLTVFLPPSEEWSYLPWQDASQKYEKNIYD